MSGPRIMMNITHGFQARMLLRTDIASHLLDSGAQIIIVSPNADEPYFHDEFSRPGFILEQSPAAAGFLETQLKSMRTYFLMNPSLGATLNHKRDWYRRNYPNRARVTRALNVILGNIPALRKAYLAFEARVFRGSEFDALLERHQPHLVVTGTPGYTLSDTHLLRAAQRKQIPTATVMLSWDNLTSKGYMGAHPETLLVWNDLMRREAMHYHDFDGPIIEVGAAMFDVYERARRTYNQPSFRGMFGIPTDARLVLWGTISSMIYPNQLDVIRDYISRVEASSRPPFLWIRLHPQTIYGPHADLLEDFGALEGPHVHVEVPPVASQRLKWDLPQDQMEHLAHLLFTAQVLVTPQSTLTIDAACTDTPVVNLAIDKDFAPRIEDTHYQNVTKHDGVWVVREMDELVNAIESYSADPTLHRGGRAAIVQEQMGSWYGQAGERTAQTLLQLSDPAKGEAEIVAGPVSEAI